jgi:hypothetical protein
VSSGAVKPSAKPSRRLVTREEALKAQEAFEASRTPRQREIDRKVEKGEWGDDWTLRAREMRVSDFEDRKDPVKCKPRPTDSRKNRGAGSRDERMRFVPWCERKG